MMLHKKDGNVSEGWFLGGHDSTYHNIPTEVVEEELKTITKAGGNDAVNLYDKEIDGAAKDSSWAAAGSSYCPIRVWRIKDEVINKLDTSLFYTTDSSYDNNPGKDADVAEMLSLFNIDEMSQKDKMSKFYYNGIPDGKYSVGKSVFDIIVESLPDIIDFIIGLSTMVFRMVIVGWTALVEKVVNAALEAITGGDSMESVHVNATEIKTGDGVTLEKIIFNKMSVFDVNFFNFNDEK